MCVQLPSTAPATDDGTGDDGIDEAYRAKCHYSPSAVSHITNAQARSTTIELVPGQEQHG